MLTHAKATRIVGNLDSLDMLHKLASVLPPMFMPLVESKHLEVGRGGQSWQVTIAFVCVTRMLVAEKSLVQD